MVFYVNRPLLKHILLYKNLKIGTGSYSCTPVKNKSLELPTSIAGYHTLSELHDARIGKGKEECMKL